MRKFLVIVVVLVVSSGPACSKSTPSATSESSPASVAVVSETTAACPDLSADNPFVIKIQDMAFEPSCLTAAGSSTIRIVNMDSVAHTFTIDGTQVDVTIDAGQTFNGESAGLEPGEYTFHCTIHPSMTGTITVV